MFVYLHSKAIVNHSVSLCVHYNVMISVSLQCKLYVFMISIGYNVTEKGKLAKMELRT